ncbi:MAG TPA: tetratricopeptide repeat protein [Pyrinomonadaceae bacterium]|nr:tetratricopeptide repeat protein [Pyrinomonadaceae bacterium]
MKRTELRFFAAAAAALALCAPLALGQSGATRPRRVNPVQPAPSTTDNAASTSRTPSVGARPQGTTASAYALLKQGQYEAALREAEQITAADAKNAEAWKIAGFAQRNLKRYADAAESLQRAYDLRREAKVEDPEAEDALAEAYALSESYEKALPLLVASTARKGAPPRAGLLYLRGLAEVKTGRAADAERSFAAALRADPKDKGSLYYLGQMAFQKGDYTTAVNMFNRATLVDPKLVQAWQLLTHAYLRRAQGATGPKADADYLAAVRASESLLRAQDSEENAALHGQALIFAKQYAPAAAALERAAAGDSASGATLYLLGFAHSRAKNFPKAIGALERAAAKTPDNAEIFRELGYVYEASKQYSQALAAYERGQQLAPTDAYFKESAERVRPFAKQ